jgi:hypothetical protein
MVKYTGYGNAAGFLAKRGVMLGGNSNVGSSSGAQYSSDSEDSDTEEYKKFKSQYVPTNTVTSERSPALTLNVTVSCNYV